MSELDEDLSPQLWRKKLNDLQKLGIDSKTAARP